MSAVSTKLIPILTVGSKNLGCKLIDPEMDLEPLINLSGGDSGWKDRDTGISFQLSFARIEDDGFDGYYLGLVNDERFPKKFLCRLNLRLVSNEVNLEDIKTYQVSYKDFFQKTFGSISADRSVVKENLDSIGTEQYFFDYVLRMARACHCVFGGIAVDNGGAPYIQARKLADIVLFDVVD